MSLHKVSSHLAEQGRGPDDQLVHMSSRELAGLQALAQAHGGSLTRNPKTGLPEAGFLDSILPTVLGAGLAFATDGAISPAMIGLGTGALTAASTGNLGQGIMSGLGAYGGAGLTGNLAATGSSMIGEDMPMADRLSAGAQALAADPSASLVGGWKNVAAAAAPALSAAMQPKAIGAAQTPDATIRPYTFSRNKQTPTNMIGSTYVPGQDTSERQWFSPTYTAGTPYQYVPGAANGGLMALAAGGMSNLGSYSDGGRLLKGPGDGVSDSIPAQIGENQPARLADGEFVVPARIVSELGNGSTEAGARQLYKMMDRVQGARRKTTGKGKMAEDTAAAQYLPA